MELWLRRRVGIITESALFSTSVLGYRIWYTGDFLCRIYHVVSIYCPSCRYVRRYTAHLRGWVGKVHTPPQKVSRVVKARIKPEVEIGGREGGIEIEIGRRGKFLMLGAKSSPPLLGSRTTDFIILLPIAGGSFRRVYKTS